MDDLLTRDDIRKLAETRDGPCVSLYLPTERVKVQADQGRIRLKNLLGRAEEQLVARGLRGAEARELLAPGQRLLDQPLFWQYQSDGLTLFLTRSQARQYRVPVRFEELAVVAERFHLKPLFPLLSGDGRFYVLALSQDDVRLLEGTRHSINEIALEGMPRTLADALRYDDPEKQLQFHTRAPVRGGERAAMFHGQGVGKDDQKDRLLRYFQEIDRGLSDLLQTEQAPLVLAGVEYYFPIYREANTYRHLLPDGVAGNPEGLHEKELHARAWSLVQPRFEQERQEAAALYQQGKGTGRTARAVEEVVPAAHEGRVASLFVARGVQQWGTFDAGQRSVKVHAEWQPGDEDLLDRAAVETWANRGAVYAVEPEQVPDEGPLAAVYRY